MCMVGVDAAQRQQFGGSLCAHHVRWSLLVECTGLIGALFRTGESAPLAMLGRAEWLPIGAPCMA
jgi:hypothetical protein